MTVDRPTALLAHLSRQRCAGARGQRGGAHRRRGGGGRCRGRRSRPMPSCLGCWPPRAGICGRRCCMCRRPDATEPGRNTPYDDYDAAPTDDGASPVEDRRASGLVRDSGAEHLIVRTGWLFGGASPAIRKNFVFQAGRWRRQGTELMRSDPTQTGNPTFVEDLASAMLGRVPGRGCGGRATSFRAARRRGSTMCARSCGCPDCRAGWRQVRRSASRAGRGCRTTRRRRTCGCGLLGLDTMGSWQDGLSRYVDGLRKTAEPGVAMTGVTR